MSQLWGILLLIVVVCTLLSSIRLSLTKKIKLASNPFLNFITSEHWCFSLILFLPWHIGSFARGEDSAIPWESFAQSYERHGLYDGFLSLGIVLIVDLWLFWTAANLWIKKHPDSDRTKRIMVRIINLLLGLLLTQVSNPIYRLIEYG